jgi:hypothetical protein
MCTELSMHKKRSITYRDKTKSKNFSYNLRLAKLRFLFRYYAVLDYAIKKLWDFKILEVIVMVEELSLTKVRKNKKIYL